MTEESRWGVVYSPKSGINATHKRWKHIRKYMEQKCVQYDFVQSESFGSVGRLVNMLCDNGYHTIVIVGGDHALNEGINAIMKKFDMLPEDFAFSIIPNGNGNDFSRFWGVTEKDYKNVIDGIIARNEHMIDVAYCTYYDKDNIPLKRYFLNCLNIGLGARLIKTMNDAANITGSRKLSVVPALISNVFERKTFNFEFKIESEKMKGKYMSVCIGNCLGYGQTPNGKPYNGMLDVSVITRPGWWQIFEGFWLLGKGRFLNYKNVHPYRANKIIVTETDNACMSFDGVVPQTKINTPLTIGVLREKIRFLAPKIAD